MRNTMTVTLKEHYVMAAEAKGLSDNEVKYKHAARNALLPLVTITGIRFSMAVAGSIFVEQIFSYPGIGRLIYNAVLNRDYPVLQGSFFVFSVVVIAVNFIVDLIYMRLDPRVRFK
ncbi:MAG: ABC transporter permease [Chloroflexi bacterium]|nr:ABC transporter permease [Chloroflexota bacterium]